NREGAKTRRKTRSRESGLTATCWSTRYPLSERSDAEDESSNSRTGPDGHGHGPPARRRGISLGGLQPQRGARRPVGGGGGGGRRLAARGGIRRKRRHQHGSG